MRVHTFPEHYGEECVLVELDKAFIPILIGQVELLLQRRYWATDEDYYQGHSAAAEAIAAMANNCLQALIDSNNKIYMLLDTLIRGASYAPVDGVIPAIPAYPQPVFSSLLKYQDDKQGFDNEIANLWGILLGFYDVGMVSNLFVSYNNDTQSDQYIPSKANLKAILDAINTMVSGQGVPLDYTDVLNSIAFNTNLTRANAQTSWNLTLRQLCCDLATVEPLPSLGDRPSDVAMCAGLQVIGGAIRDALHDLQIYRNRSDYIDATGVALYVNRDFQARSIPNISQPSATQLTGRMLDLLPGGSPWEDYFGDANQASMRTALYGASSAEVARSLWDQWVDTTPFIPYEIQQLLKAVGGDMAIWNALFDGTINTEGVDGTLCGGTGGGGDIQIVSAVEGLIVDTNDMSEIAGYHHFYLEVPGGFTAYHGVQSWNTVSGFDTRHMYRSESYAGGLNDPGLQGYYNTDWGGVQLMINEGPDDVSIVFYPTEGTPPIGLSKTSWTTVPAGTTNFIVYALSDDHAPYTPFSLKIIFPA